MTTAPTTAPDPRSVPRLSIVVPLRDEAASVEPLAYPLIRFARPPALG